MIQDWFFLLILCDFNVVVGCFEYEFASKSEESNFSFETDQKMNEFEFQQSELSFFFKAVVFDKRQNVIVQSIKSIEIKKKKKKIYSKKKIKNFQTS